MTSSCSVNEWHHTDTFAATEATDLLALQRTFEDMNARRKKRHRISMVAFRKKQKNANSEMVAEHRRLVREMKRLAGNVRAVAARSSREGEETAINNSVANALRELVVERDSLWNQNRALREAIKRQQTFQNVVLKEADLAAETDVNNLLVYDLKPGWRVRFERGEPSFHFQPFTKDEYDATLERFDKSVADGLPSVSTVGTFLGWKVHRAPLTTSVNNCVVAQVRLTKRVHCPLDVLLMVSHRKDKDVSPLLLTPVGWSIHQRHEVDTQVLQEFDADSCIFVHNIPGPDKHLRYLLLSHRAQYLLPDGRRRMVATLAIIDSEANRLNREADASQDDVEWATDGGMRVSLTEVDETSIDVVCDRWAGCENAMHADYVIIQWAQFANWWEQMNAPASLLL